jgi:hypothetical protein
MADRQRMTRRASAERMRAGPGAQIFVCLFFCCALLFDLLWMFLLLDTLICVLPMIAGWMFSKNRFAVDVLATWYFDLCAVHDWWVLNGWMISEYVLCEHRFNISPFYHRWHIM